jgi:hypothetical protein
LNSDYKDLMGRLRHANETLYRMTTQTSHIAAHQASVTAQSKYSPNFRVVKERAESFYSALRSDWKCPCQADHSVSLRLEPRMEDSPSDDDEDDERCEIHSMYYSDTTTTMLRFSVPQNHGHGKRLTFASNKQCICNPTS